MRNLRHYLLLFLLTMTSGLHAQFVITGLAGDTLTKVNRTNFNFVRIGGNWQYGAIPVSKMGSISLMPMETRLKNYTAPTYIDYYANQAGWNSRSIWNLSNVHDPTVVLAEDGYYYMYQTDAGYGNPQEGHGHFMCRRSRDLVSWQFMGATMQQLPTWVEPKLNEIRAAMGLPATTADLSKCGYWAPCVRKVSDGLYRMYYVITIDGTINGEGTWGERSFIGLMETATPADVKSWEDKGFVITNYSDKLLNYQVGEGDYWQQCYFKYNAIDPSYIITENNEHWLIYGSWHSGLAAVQLDAETGMPLHDLGNPWGDNEAAYGVRVATRQDGNRWQGSEAPEVVYHDGWYYLFMAYDELSVAYNTRVVRSRNITGPYRGIDNANVTAGAEAFPIVTHPYRFSNSDGWVGISHCAVFDDGQGNWFFSSQGRLPANVNDNPYSNALMMGQVRRIVWTENGWPLVMPERYGAVPQVPISEEELLGEWEHINLEYSYQNQDVAVKITLGENHKVTGDAFNGMTWKFNVDKNILTIGAAKLYLQREVDWEASPRRATIVYAGYSGTHTYWGKKI